MKYLSTHQTPLFSRTVIICATFLFSLGSIPMYGQHVLLEEIMALSKVKKGLQFDPSAVPANANPYLSLLPPGSKSDYQGWHHYYRRRDQYNKLTQSFTRSSFNTSKLNSVKEMHEKEKVPGQNDTQSQGQQIKRFGTRSSEINHVVVRGISGEQDRKLQYHPAKGMEDDGSIPFANATGIQEIFIGERYPGIIGDGPVDGLSDFDFYKVEATMGQTLYIEVKTPEPFLDLDPFLSVFDENGELLAINDDGSAESFDSKLRFEVPFDDSFYICVGGYGAFIPSDPFSSESGSVTGELGSEGEYELLATFMEISSDIDYYVFKLRKGDVFAAAIKSRMDAPFITVNKPGTEVAISAFSNTSFYPIESPLSLEGNSSLYHIAEEHGNYAVSVSGNYGAYELELFVTRPNLEVNGGTQIVFLDFDGAEFDLNEFLGIPGSDVRQLSPFRDFLDNWGISDDPSTVSRLTRRIVLEVRENLKRDMLNSKINPNFNVGIIGNTGLDNNFALAASGAQSKPNLRVEDLDLGTGFHGLDNHTSALLDGFDLQGDFESSPFPISRVIVGGTIEESGIATVGIAQSIDPGNFATQETALVLLDILSAPPVGIPESFSLNDIPRAPGVDMEDLVVKALGNIISHEIGHYLGNWHTDGFDDVQTLMDEGPGGIFNLIGMAPFGTFGDDQTIDVDFGTGGYSTLEFFMGTENTQNQTAWGLISRPDHMLEPVITHANQIAGVELSQAYPNPSTLDQVLSIDFKVDEEGPVQVEVYDFSGKKVAVLFNDIAEAERKYHLNFNPFFYRLESGTYIYRMLTEKGTISKKIYLRK